MRRIPARSAAVAGLILSLTAPLVLPQTASAQFWVQAQGYTDAWAGMVDNRNMFGGSDFSTGHLNQSAYDLVSQMTANDSGCTYIQLPGDQFKTCLQSGAHTQAGAVGHIAMGSVDMSVHNHGFLSPGGTIPAAFDYPPYSIPVNRNGLPSQAATHAAVEWQDRVTFHSSSLSSIAVTFTLAVTGSLDVVGDFFGLEQDPNIAIAFGYANTPVGTLTAFGSSNAVGGRPGTGTAIPNGLFQVSGFVANGAAYDISGGADISALALASNNSPDLASTVDASYRLYISYDPSDVTLQSASGETYSAVVATPEPASMALFATGLLGVIGVARRKRRRASS
jgi:hypothetical protein